MSDFLRRLPTLALAMGAPGLFLVAFLDSSVLSLPEVADLLVVWMVTSNRARFAVYVLAATAGLLLGCLILYYLGRKGGEALVRRRFSSDAIDRALASFQRYGVMAVLIPSILPPPAPFKIFVLLAGLADIGAAQFTAAIIVGRGARFLALGVLALVYGERAIAFLRTHGTAASLALVGLLVVGFVGYLWWASAGRRRRAERL